MAWWQFVAGTSKPLLEYPDIDLPHFETESKYIASLRRYLASIGASIEVDDPGIPALQRDHDVYIMEEVLNSGSFSATEIKYVNLCRLYLQVVTLSDMSNAAGTKLDPSIKAGTPSKLAPQSRWLKCHQERPLCKYVWKAWRKACRLFATNKGKLHRPLGKWLCNVTKLRCQWPAYYVHSRDHLYVRHEDHFRIHHQRISHHFTYDFYSTCHTLPTEALPTDIKYEEEGIHLQGNQIIQPPEESPAPSTFSEYLNTIPEWEQRLFFGLQWMQDSELLQTAILEDNLIIVSDGSAPDKASFGWIMSTSTGTRIVKCCGPTWGYNPSSYRAEGHGILSATCFLLRYQRYHHILPNKAPKEYCDNKGLLDNIKKYSQYHGNHYPNDSLSADWDVVTEIITTRKALVAPPSLHHVKGHQDKDKPYESLPLTAQLNVDADSLAAEYMHYHYNQHLRAPLTTNAKALLHLPAGTSVKKENIVVQEQR